MKRKLPLTTFSMRTLWPLGLLLILSGCGADQLGSKIDIKSIFNPDEVPPEIAIVSMQSDMERLGDYSITYQLRDDVKGSGIGSSKVYYSPDPDTVEFSPIGSLKEGVHDLKVCAPNSTSHPNPTFRFEATDRNDNKMDDYELALTEEATSLPALQPMLINELLPEATLTPFPKTTANTVEVAINACKRRNCSNDALQLEDLQNNTFIKVQLNDATQPGASDGATATETAWVDCEDVLTNGLTSPALPSDGDHVLSVWVKSVDTDYTDVSSTSEDVTINYDTTPPVLTDRVVEGPTLIAKSKASYRLNDCSDISYVFINKGGEPAADDEGWQACGQEFYSMSYTNYIEGDNTLNFWVKDDVDNVNSTPLTYTTSYNPPDFSIVDGPTITKPIADITISFCQEADIEYVLFNSDGTLPDTNDSSWQTCSKTVGHLKSYELAPGPHTMKAFLKYEDGLISPNPLDVNVTYSPLLTWLDSPSVNRPQTTFSVASCEGVDSVLIQEASLSAPTDMQSADWQACDTATALSYDSLDPGTNNLKGWLKDTDDNLYPNPVETSAVFTPPNASVVDGPDISTSDSKAALTISECEGISEVYVELTNTQPASGDGAWESCSTAFGAFKSPVLTEGANSIYTWFKYDDGTILSFADQDDITFTPPDTTPPPTTGLTLTLENGDASTPPILQSNSSRAFFTLNSCDPTAAGTVEDIITGVYLSVDSTTKPSSDETGWMSCSTAASELATVSMADGVRTVSFFFKDEAGNVTDYDVSFDQNVEVDTSTAPLPADVPRPPIEIQNAPTLTMSPAKMRIDQAYDCTGIDQLYFEIDEGVESEPSSSSPIWQDCADATFDMTYQMILAGEYNLRAWFKSPEGIINPTPRKVSFIFDPSPSSLAVPVAYWSLDQEHIYKQKAVDIMAENHLTISSPVEVSAKSDGAVKQGLDLSGTKSYLVGRNQASLKPTVGVTLSLWAYLTNGDTDSKALAGNLSGSKGYGLELQSGSLRFSVNGLTSEVSVGTGSISTGWHHIVGTSNGQLTELYIDGEKVADHDTGTPANIEYGCTDLFAIGAKVDCTTNVVDGTFFDNALDEVVVWSTKLSSDDVFQHYVDTANEFKVNQNTTASTSVTTSSFYREITDSALFTVPDCSGIQFVYSDTTTHPPTLTSPRWQPCAEFTGAFHREDLAVGPHELKIWTKDGYGNLSSTYDFLDTTIEVDTGAPNPILMYNFDNTHISSGKIFDLFSLQHAQNSGADSVASIENEGLRFKSSESDYIEAKDAAYAQVTDELSISAWANILPGETTAQVIAGNRTGSGHGYSLEIESGGDLSLIVETDQGQRKTSLALSSINSGYSNIIGTYNGDDLSLYINGSLKSTENYAGVIGNITYNCLSSFVVGARATCNEGGVAPFYNNIIDEVAVWNQALDSTQAFKFYSGQDNIPPEPVAVTPRDNEYTVGIPVAKLNVSDCSDAASVYVALDDAVPPSDASNWQACSESGDLIETPLLANGENVVKVWFKDAAENVSDTPYTMNPNITFTFDFTIPEPGSYWSFNRANVDGSTIYDLINDHHGTSTSTSEVDGASYEGLSFNGTSSRITAPHTTAHQPTDAISLSAWVKVDSFPVGEKTIVGNAYGNGGYALTLDGNEVVWKVYVNGAFQTIRVDVSTWNLSEYHLVTGTYGQGVLRLFVDNVEAPSLDLGDSALEVVYEHTNAFKIGAQVDDTVGNVAGTFYDGNIDEVSMWPNALTDTVVNEIYSRGQNNDQIYYNVTPPDMPTTLSIDYYNSLVSRANLTVTDCTDIDYIIVTDSEFPPDKNDEDWQLCNTLVGGTLSKELSTSEEFGKVWTKDVSGNISKEFEYTPLTTKYDLPIARPIVHWTFDNAHYNSTDKYFFDRISGAKLHDTVTYIGSYRTEDLTYCPQPDGYDLTSKRIMYNTDAHPTDTGTASNQSAILLEGAKIKNSSTFLRTNDMGKLRPKNEFSLSVWVEITPGETAQKHIVSTWENSGYAVRLREVDNRNRLEFVVKLQNGETLAPYLETGEITDDPDTGSNWHLVTAVYDGQKASLYFDGIFVKSFSAATSSPIDYNDSVPLMVGADPSPSNYPNGFGQCQEATCGWSSCSPDLEFEGGYNNGKIDEILIWDKPLTGLMVSSLYHNGADIIYEGDITPPTPPSVAQENQRPLMYSDTVYASVLDCNDVSGVLVNEGTQPDKQDSRWEVCREREGSFKYENLTPGGHTVTLWFKDAAGNVTSSSSDVVIDYVSLDTPKANAYWPLDSTHYIDRQQRDIISDSKEHELHASHFNNDLNPTTDSFPFGPNASRLAVDLSNNAYLSAASTRLLRPVNELSVGGWFYLTQNDSATKYLIDKYDETSSNPSGYRMYLAGGNLNFNTTLYIHADSNLSVPTSSYTTGWHHVMGVFDGLQTYLYLDGALVDSSGLLSEPDFVVWSDNTPMNVGASSNDFVLPSSYFNDKVSDVAVWGMALDATEVSTIHQKGVDGEAIATPPETPNNVSNAYAYYYDTFGPRARVTILNCTNTPYIRVTDTNSAPSNTGEDWHDCRTDEGAIISEELAPGTNEVYVWAKNANGDVSTTAAILEIDNPITDDRALPLPYSYFSMNSEHFDSNPLDYLLGQTASISGSVSLSNFLDKQAATIGSSSGDYMSVVPYRKNDIRDGITVMLWAELSQNESDDKGLFSTASEISSRSDLAMYTKGGRVYFEVYRSRDRNYEINSDYAFASFPTSYLKNGANFLSATYNGRKIQLYHDGVLMDEVDIPTEYFQNDTDRRIQLDRLHNFLVGRAIVPTTPGSSSSASTRSANTKVDEFMVFDDILTETEVWNHYKRLKDFAPNDTDPLVTTPNIAVEEMTDNGGGSWTSDRKSPYYTLDTCDGMSSVYISTSATAPVFDTPGWQACSTENGNLTGPDLSSGANTVYFWFRDRYGNISSSQSIDVTYNIPPTPDPIAYWPFDVATIFNGRGYEVVGQKHADIYYAESVAAKRNEGLDFDKTSHFVRVPHDASLKTEEFTISGWFNLRSMTYNVLATNSQNSGDGWRLRVYNSNSLTSNAELKTYLQFSVATTAGQRVSTIPFLTLYGTNTMRHLAVTYDGRRVRWYVDSSLVHTEDFGTNARAVYTEQTPLFIGSDYSSKYGSSSLLDGVVDEFALFDRALTDEHVLDIYNRTHVDNLPIYDTGRTNIASADIAARVTEVYQSTELFMSNRIRLTLSGCTDIDMIHVSDRTTAPPADDPDWQTCNTFHGGILSAPLSNGDTVTPVAYTRTFEGVVSSTSGSTGETVKIGGLDASGNVDSSIPVETIPRSSAHFSLNSYTQNYKSGSTDTAVAGDEIYDSHNYITEGPFGRVPTSEQCNVPSFTTTEMIHEGGYVFNRVNSECLTFPSQPANLPEHDITISAWAELSRGDTTDQYIVSNRQNGTNESGAGAGLRLKDGELQFFVSVRTKDAVSSTTGFAIFEEEVGFDTQLYDDGLRFVTGTYDGRSLRLYLDGVEVASKRLQIFGPGRYYMVNDTVTPWMIGAEVSTSNGPALLSHFNGKIDDMRIWPEVLTESQIFALFTYGSQFIPGNVSDGIPPVRDDVAISEDSTILSKPFANIKMPSCVSQDNSGATPKINAVYIMITDSSVSVPGDIPNTPTASSGRDINSDGSPDGTGWLYCTLDPDQLRSLVLQAGPSNVWVFLRDEEGDVGLASDTPIEVEYDPPIMISSIAYYDFETSTGSHYDEVSGIALRGSNGITSSPSIQSAAHVTCEDDNESYCPTSEPNGFGSKTTSVDFEIDKNFAISFWHYPRSMTETSPQYMAHIPNQFYLKRHHSTNEVAFRINAWGAGPERYSQNSLFLDQWNHILLTRTGTTVSLYLNGSLDTTFEMWDVPLGVSNNWFEFATAEGHYDELTIFDKGLTEDQSLYLFFLGSNNLSVDQRLNQVVPAKIPDHYYTFDSSDVATNKLIETLGSGLDFDIFNNVDTANSTSKVGESFYFTRYVPEDPISNDSNTSGLPEYLEANAPVELGENFTISVWVNPTKPNSARNEFYTILNQWGETAAEQSFDLRMHRRGTSTSSTVDRYQFRFRIGTGTGSDHMIETNDTFGSPGQWHHLVIKKHRGQVVIYVNGVERGFKNIADNYKINYDALNSPNLRIGTDYHATYAEGNPRRRFEGHIDELGIWKSESFNYRKLRDLYLRASDADPLNNIALPYQPEVVLLSETNTTSETEAPLSINDCGGHSHVRVSVDGGAFSSWVSCTTTEGGILTPDLSGVDGTRSIQVQFSTDGINPNYSYDFDIQYEADNPDPAPSAPLATLVGLTNPYPSSFIDITVDNCTDVTAYFIGPTGSTPTPTQSGWKGCSTSIKYKDLIDGTNNFSIWFKDEFGQFATTGQADNSQQFTVNYERPPLPSPEFYFSFEGLSAGSAAVIELSQNSLYKSSGTNSTILEDSLTPKAYRFNSNEYLESMTEDASGELTLGTNFTIASWLNVSTPSEARSAIINEWSGTDTEDRFSLEVDKEGRLCFAFQTTSSTGDADLNSTKYRRTCSFEKLTFSTWQHVAVTRSGLNLDLYINGEVVQGIQLENEALKAFNSAVPTRVGAQGRGNGTYALDGSIDELGVWNQTLTTDEILGHYSLGTEQLALDYPMYQAQAPALPIHYWNHEGPFSGSDPFYLDDQVGPLDLEQTNVTLDSTDGLISNFSSFDGTAQYKSISDALGITRDFTVATWVKYSSGTGSNTPLVYKWGASSSDQDFKLEILSDDKVRFTYNTFDGAATATSSVTSNTTLDVDEWSHIAVTRKEDRVLLFINGTIEGMLTGVDAENLNLGTARTILASQDGSNFLYGDMDETAIWAKPMEPWQIHSIYERSAQEVAPEPLPTTMEVSVWNQSNTVSNATTTANLTISECPYADTVVIIDQNAATPGDWTGAVSCSEEMGGLSTPTLNAGTTEDYYVHFKDNAGVDTQTVGPISITRE